MPRWRCERGDVAFIYVLRDPRDDTVRYVGVSFGTPGDRYYGQNKALARRLNGHVHTPSSFQMRDWVGELQALGLRPLCECVQTVPCEHGVEMERWWIAELRNRGCDLLNKIRTDAS
jgi:hypothetical protein